MTRAEQAVAYHNQGYNCAQAVVLAFGDVTGLPEGTAAKMAMALGGGMGQMRSLCGAVNGTAIVLGLAQGLGHAPLPEEKQAMYARVAALGERFEAHAGSLQCLHLLKLASRTDPMPPPESRPCNALIAEAVRLLEAELAAGSEGGMDGMVNKDIQDADDAKEGDGGQ